MHCIRGSVMSAEKEVGNHWYNKKGYFTISNLKSKNRDLGILALKPDTNEVLHVQVSCSLTGAFETKEKISAGKISEEKFYDDSIAAAILKNIPLETSKSWKRVLVLSSMPKSRTASVRRPRPNNDSPRGPCEWEARSRRSGLPAGASRCHCG